MKQKLANLIIHCLATPEGKHFTKDDVIRWHTAPKIQGGRAWKKPGYGDMIYLDGQLVNLVPFDTDDFIDLWEISNGVEGMNGNSRHIAYVGGMDKENKKAKDTRTHEQTMSLETYLKYMILRHPDIQIAGHNEVPNAKGKACPSFSVSEWCRSIGIAEKNIYKKHDLQGREAGSPAVMETAATEEQ